jgi:hypothetical protein
MKCMYCIERREGLGNQSFRGDAAGAAVRKELENVVFSM